MLKVDHLTLTHRRDLTDLVRDLSFTLSPGEHMALIGEEGNGKSTLLRCIAGGAHIPGYIDMQGSIRLSSPAGYLPQELPESDREKSAYAFFCDSPSFYDMEPRELAAQAAALGLSPDAVYSEQRMADFSGGERVKLMLLRTLTEHPGVLLLDEPSNDLDGETVRWLGDFLTACPLPVLFVSHDEALLSRAATSVLLLERLRRRQTPRAEVWHLPYDDFVQERESGFQKQEQIARKEREEADKRQARYEAIRRQVERDQAGVSRQCPGTGRLLKKKMHTVLAMGRRFEREAETMTAMPEREEAIFARLGCDPLPPGKTVLSLQLPELRAPDGRLLARDVALTLRGQEKALLCGKNGAGKSTLLRAVRDALAEREDLRVFYMPQDPGELLRGDSTPLELLSRTGDKEERDRNAVALGSMKFTAEEMQHPCRGLSGGQKAKLMFLMMAASRANVLLLDEPTRNLSPLSGPVVRALFDAYPGCVLAVSHDARFARAVFSRALRLTPRGLEETEFDGI